MKTGRPLGFEETAWGPLAVDWAISLVGLATFKIMSDLSVDVDDEEKEAASLLRSYYASKLPVSSVEDRKEIDVGQRLAMQRLTQESISSFSSFGEELEASQIEVLSDVVRLAGQIADSKPVSMDEAQTLSNLLRTVRNKLDDGTQLDRHASLN